MSTFEHSIFYVSFWKENLYVPLSTRKDKYNFNEASWLYTPLWTRKAQVKKKKERNKINKGFREHEGKKRELKRWIETSQVEKSLLRAAAFFLSCLVAC